LGFLIGLGGCIQTIFATQWNIEERHVESSGASQAFVAAHCAYAGLIAGQPAAFLGLLAVVPSLGYAKF